MPKTLLLVLLVLLVPLLAVARAGAQETTFSLDPPRPAPGDERSYLIDHLLRYMSTQTGGQPVEPNADEESSRRLVRITEREPAGDRRCLEVEYESDRIENQLGVFGLAGRTIRVTGGPEPSAEVVGDRPLDDYQARRARADGALFLSIARRRLLLPADPVAVGATWTLDGAGPAALFCDVDEPDEVEITVRFREVAEGQAVLEFKVRIADGRMAERTVSSSKVTGSGELRVDLESGRIDNWISNTTIVEEDRIEAEDGPIVLRYEASEDLLIEAQPD